MNLNTTIILLSIKEFLIFYDNKKNEDEFNQAILTEVCWSFAAGG